MEAELTKALADLVTVTNVLAAFMAGLVVDLHKAWANKTKPGPGWWRPFVRLPATAFGKRTVRVAPIAWCILFLMIPGLWPADPETGKPAQIGIVLGMGAFWGVCASWVYGAVMGVLKKREPEPVLPVLPGPPTPKVVPPPDERGR